jgi:hypothetical protein
MTIKPRNVIVYDTPSATNLVYYVPVPGLQQLVLGKRMALNDALALIVARDLPDAVNVDYATDDQLPLLRQVKGATIATLYRDAQAAMLAGYTSSALGNPHTYPSSILDQQNMTVSVLSSLLPNLDPAWTTLYLCADNDTSVWDFYPHTATQIQQAGSDGKNAITTMRMRLAQLVGEVAAAQDIETVQQITW